MNNAIFQREIVVFFSTIPMMYFISKVIKSKKCWLVTILGTFVATLIHYLFTYVIVKNQLMTTAMTISYFIVFVLIFGKESTSKKILSVALALVGMFLGEILGLQIWNAIAGTSITTDILYTDEFYWITYMSSLIITVVYIFVYYLFYIVWQRVINKTKDRVLGYFVIFPVSQAMLIWFIQSYAISNRAPSGIYITILCMSIASIIADAILFKTIKSLNQKYLIEQKNLLMEQELNKGWDYYNNLILNLEGVNKIRHDIRNQIMTINALIDKKEFTKAKKQVKDLEKNISNTESKICENHIVACVMEEKIKLCDKEHIKVLCDINVPKDIKIKGIDLCSLYANIMDNAINASKKCKKKEINITTKIEKGYLVVSEDNYYVLSNKKTNKKEKLPKHGLGLEIINDIVARYDGNVKIISEDNIFKITIFLKIS